MPHLHAYSVYQLVTRRLLPKLRRSGGEDFFRGDCEDEEPSGLSTDPR